MKQAHVFIRGSVQGVGFRFFIKSWAKQNGIAGWVTNAKDGSVEALFQGDEKLILELIEKCKKGPFLAEVKKIDASWEEPVERYGDFQVM